MDNGSRTKGGYSRHVTVTKVTVRSYLHITEITSMNVVSIARNFFSFKSGNVQK